jgi:hypothetical protein
MHVLDEDRGGIKKRRNVYMRGVNFVIFSDDADSTTAHWIRVTNVCLFVLALPEQFRVRWFRSRKSVTLPDCNPSFELASLTSTPKEFLCPNAGSGRSTARSSESGRSTGN